MCETYKLLYLPHCMICDKMTQPMPTKPDKMIIILGRWKEVKKNSNLRDVICEQPIDTGDNLYVCTSPLASHK